MGVYDREYLQDDYGTDGRQVRFVRPALPPVVKWLLIINIAVYLVCAIIPPIADVVYTWGSVYPASWGLIGQVWRFISYQFLHDLINFFHVLFNMMVLYFFGPPMEQLWGSKRFLKFYLCAGAAGGIIYTLLVIFGVLTAVPMVGASGALYGILGAVAVLFPHAQVFLFGIIPMSMRTLAILSVIISLLRFTSGVNAGGEAAHLTGMAIGVLYVFYQPLRTALRMKKHKSRWSQQIDRERTFQAEVDRILDKVHKEGLPRLTRKEKNILQEATRREQEQLRQP